MKNYSLCSQKCSNYSRRDLIMCILSFVPWNATDFQYDLKESLNPSV